MGPGDADFLSSLSGSLLPGVGSDLWVAGGLCIAATAVAVAVGLMLSKALPGLVMGEPEETGSSQAINFDRVLKDGLTMRRHDGHLVRVISLAGVDRGAMPQSLKDELYERLKAWYESFQERSSVEIRIFERKVRMPMGVGGQWDSPALQALFGAYHKDFTETHRMLFFIVLSVAPKVAGGREALHRASEDMLADMDDFQPTLLTNTPVEVRGRAGIRRVSPLLSVWSELLNPVDPAPVPPATRDLTRHVTWTTYQFDDQAGRGILRFLDGPRVVYGQVCCVSKWGETSNELTVQSLMAIPAELTILHLIDPFDRITAQNIVKVRERWALGGRFNASLAGQLEAANSFLTDGADPRQSLLRYQMAVILYADSEAELENLVRLARIAMRKVEATLVVAPTGAAERIWWSQLPGHRNFVFYQDLWSGNVAKLAQFGAPSVGLSRSEWGEGPIVPLRQMNGSPYNFTFHVSEEPEEVGHMVVFGPTGTGKTLLMNFLMGASLRLPRVRWFRFDRDQGAYPFVRCLGPMGTFLALQSSLEDPDSCVINPFQMNLESETNLKFLERWLRDRANDMVPDLDQAELIEEITRFVRALQKQPDISKRSLSNIYRSVFDRNSPIYDAIKPWADPAMFGRYVNGARDTFDPKRGGRLVAIDVTQVFKDPLLSAALIDYFWFRIKGYAEETGDPWGLFIDETEPMVRASPRFLNETIRQGLQESRRARGVVVLAFQRQAAIHELGISDLVTEQCKTQIYLRNPKAKRKDFPDLTEEQFAIMRGRHPLVRGKRYTILMMRDTPAGSESVVLNFDLSAIGKPLKILRGGRRAIDTIVRLERELGAHNFLNAYLDDDGVELMDEDEDEVDDAA